MTILSDNIRILKKKTQVLSVPKDRLTMLLNRNYEDGGKIFVGT